MPGDTLRALRAEVDALDDQLTALLASRFEYTRRIGLLKVEAGEPPLDPARQVARAALIDGLAQRHGVDLALLREIFGLLRSEVAGRHALVAKAAEHAPSVRNKEPQ